MKTDQQSLGLELLLRGLDPRGEEWLSVVLHEVQVELLHLDLEENKLHLISGKKKKNPWLLLHGLELLRLQQIEEEEDLAQLDHDVREEVWRPERGPMERGG